MFMAQAWSVLVAASSEQCFPRRKTSLVRALCSRPACRIPQSCRADSSAALSWRCLEIHLPMHLSPPQLPQSVLHLIRLRRFLSVRLCSCSFYSGHFSQPAYNALLPDILFLFLWLLLLFVGCCFLVRFKTVVIVIIIITTVVITTRDDNAFDAHSGLSVSRIVASLQQHGTCKHPLHGTVILGYVSLHISAGHQCCTYYHLVEIWDLSI